MGIFPSADTSLGIFSFPVVYVELAHTEPTVHTRLVGGVRSSALAGRSREPAGRGGGGEDSYGVGSRKNLSMVRSLAFARGLFFTQPVREYVIRKIVIELSRTARNIRNRERVRSSPPFAPPSRPPSTPLTRRPPVIYFFAERILDLVRSTVNRERTPGIGSASAALGVQRTRRGGLVSPRTR